MSKFELIETQFETTVREEIACKNHLEWENYCFKHIFGILIKFPNQYLKKRFKVWYSQGEKRWWQFERIVRAKSPVKPTWSKKITVLGKFLKSSLNFLFYSLKNTTNIATDSNFLGKTKIFSLPVIYLSLRLYVFFNFI